MKIRLFYGWYIAIAAMVMAALYSAIVGYGWSAFVGPITATFGWGMTQIALASSLRSIETGVFNPVWGIVVDRFPARRLMLIGVICTSLALYSLSQMQNMLMFYSSFFIVGVGSSLVTGMLPLAVIARWFKKDIGKASGLFYMGNGIGGVAVSLVVFLIDKLGWQTTLLFGAIVFMALGIPLSFLFRNRPQDYGLPPDGKVSDHTMESTSLMSPDFGTSVWEALRMRFFWHFAFVTVFQNAAVGTVILYAIPYLTSVGMDRRTAGVVVSVFTFVSLFGRIPLGMLSDVFRKSYVVSLSIALQGTGIFLFWLTGLYVGNSPVWLMLLFAIAYGLGVGGVPTLRAPILKEYFGVKNFASIFGLTSIFMSIGMVGAPPLAGWIYDTYHDYRIWWVALASFGLLALIAMLTAPRPPRIVEPEVASKKK